MFRKKRLQLILAVLLVSVFINPIPVYAEETAGEETENSFSVIDPEELDKGIEDIISPTGRSSQTVSVALYYTGTGEYYYYNADQWWYTASLFKLPLIMKISNMQKNDEIDYDHIKLDPDLETIKREVLVYSNNTWGYGLQEKIFQNDLRTIRKNDLSYSIGFDEQDLPKGFYSSYLYSARFYLGIVRELYENPDEYPNVLEYMYDASPSKYFRTNLEGQYLIAQKYGSAEHACHAGGIIYTPDPVLLVVMNNQIEDLAGNRMIGDLAAYIASCAEVWHVRLEAEKEEAAKRKAAEAAKAAEAQAYEPMPIPEPDPGVPEEAEAAEENRGFAHWGITLIYIGILLAAAVEVWVYFMLRKRKDGQPESGGEQPSLIENADDPEALPQEAPAPEKTEGEELPDGEGEEADSTSEEAGFPEVQIEVIPSEERQS